MQAIIQIAETMFPGGYIMGTLNLLLGNIFREFNTPIAEFRVRDILFDGIPICQNPGTLGEAACLLIRNMSHASQNMDLQEDGTILFSLVDYVRLFIVDLISCSAKSVNH